MQSTICMKRILFNIASYTMFLLLIWAGIAFTHSGDPEPSAADWLMVELINAARKDPLAMAEQVGWARPAVLAGFPHQQHILLNGLPPLRRDADLYRAARGHSRDMLSHSYYSFESRDGRSPLDRLHEQGYAVVRNSESLGLITFGNYIDPLTVAAILFQNLFRDELNPDWQGPRNILNPDFKDVGVSVEAGIINLGGVRLNVYVATLDYGLRREYLASLSLWHQINTMRQNPLAAIRHLGLDENWLRARMGGQSWILDHGLPPLAWNNTLDQVAHYHTEDMIRRGYFSSISPEGLDPLQRITAAGYTTLYGSETLSRLCSGAAHDPQGIANAFFNDLMRNAILQPGSFSSLLLSVKLTETGISILPGNDVCEDGKPPLFLTLTMARPDRMQSYLMGRIQADRGMEEQDFPILRFEVDFSDGTAPYTGYSGIWGEYQVPLSRGISYVRIWNAEGHLLKALHLPGQGHHILYPILLD